MNAFTKREQAFENKFAYDNKTEFKIISKRNNLIASWAADIMHFEGLEKCEYVESIIDLSVHETDSECVLSKIIEDFENTSVDSSEHDVYQMVYRFTLEAREFYQ